MITGFNWCPLQSLWNPKRFSACEKSWNCISNIEVFVCSNSLKLKLSTAESLCNSSVLGIAPGVACENTRRTNSTV